MRKAPRTLTFFTALLLLALMAFPGMAYANEESETRMFAYYDDACGTKLFREYAEGFYSNYRADIVYSSGTSTIPQFFNSIRDAFKDSDENDINIIMLETHGVMNGSIAIANTADGYSDVDAEIFRKICDLYCKGKTVIITMQCYGSVFAGEFWSAGSGEQYASDHYVIYTVSGITEGYLGEAGVFLIPFGKSTWADYRSSYYRYGKDSAMMTIAPIDLNADGYVSMRELYSYSSPIQFGFAKWACGRRAATQGGGIYGFSYPALYGECCLDMPLFKVL